MRKDVNDCTKDISIDIPNRYMYPLLHWKNLYMKEKLNNLEQHTCNLYDSPWITKEIMSKFLNLSKLQYRILSS